MGCRPPRSIVFLGGIDTISKRTSSQRKSSSPPLARKHSEIQACRVQNFRSDCILRAVTGKHNRNLCCSDAEQDPLVDSAGRDRPADEGALYTRQSKKRNAMDTLRSQVRSGRSQPVLCHWSLRGENACNREILIVL